VQRGQNKWVGQLSTKTDPTALEKRKSASAICECVLPEIENRNIIFNTIRVVFLAERIEGVGEYIDVVLQIRVVIPLIRKK